MPHEMSITKRYHWEAAHFLPNVPEGHRCARLHGHNYLVEVSVRGNVGNSGMVIDFWDLDTVVHPILASIDHYCLNDIPGLDNPTAENIALWLWKEIDDRLTTNISISQIRVFETQDCWATAIKPEVTEERNV